METLRRFEPWALLIVILGALNYGIAGLFDTNVLSEIFTGSTALDVVYVIVGVAGLVFVPRLMDELHIGRGPHPRRV